MDAALLAQVVAAEMAARLETQVPVLTLATLDVTGVAY